MYIKLDIGEISLPDFEDWKQNGIYSQQIGAPGRIARRVP